MEIYEICIEGEVYVGMDEALADSVDTQILEPNIYGKNTFLRSSYFYHFSEHGPRPVSRIMMTEILSSHEED